MRKSHIMLMYRDLSPSVLLCGHYQLKYLANQGRFEYLLIKTTRVSRKELQWADTVILARSDNSYELALVKCLKNAGKQVLYMIDDDLLNVPLECGESGIYYGQPNVQTCIREIISLSDGLISPSPILANKYKKPLQKYLMIEEPSVEPVPYRLHDKFPVRIGFAGSVDRTDDLETILGSALRKVHEKYGDRVQFSFFGAIPSFAKDLDAECIPYQESYVDYRREMNYRAWDIGLAPMPDTPFHACKHYNKFCEYAASGAVGVFSDVLPYSRIAEKYSGAVLCSNDPESWYMQLTSLIEDACKREALRAEVVQMANEQLSLSHVSTQFFKVAEKELLFCSPKDCRVTGFWKAWIHWNCIRLKKVWKGTIKTHLCGSDVFERENSMLKRK